MGTLLQVFLEPSARIVEAHNYEIVETDFDDLEQAFHAFDEPSALIAVRRLVHGPGKTRQDRIVYRREVVGLRASAVTRIQLPTWRFTEEIDT